jgi:hypothetical protein
MTGDASAYAALGLEPGADLAAIEQAYRRLIKQHHPDRAGGDAKRATEINRAYRELRAASAYRDPLELNPELELEERGRRRWLVAAMVIAGAVAGVSLVEQSYGSLAETFAGEPRVDGGRHGKSARRPRDPMDEPLSVEVIDRAIAEASFIARTSDELALAKTSTACHRELRATPSIARLDRCAAFDDAVIQLQDRDPLRDHGPFSEITVTSRLWNAAAALSDDYLAIDGRLDRIRLRVELALSLGREEPATKARASPAQPRLASVPG